MTRFVVVRWLISLLFILIAFIPRPSAAQDADSLSISGTLKLDFLAGIIGADLAEVYENADDHGWTLTLHGVWYSHDYYFDEWDNETSKGYWEQFTTRVHATGFDLQFFGPDADILNAAVSQELALGSRPNGAVFELWNAVYEDSYWWWESGAYSSFDLSLQPLDASTAVSLDVTGGAAVWPQFSADEFGFPLVEPRRVTSMNTRITDKRPGNGGQAESHDDVMDIGSADVPVLPVSVAIADGSIFEGQKGNAALAVKVTLSRENAETVTVRYATADGTAVASSDYAARSGVLTFHPGQTAATISLSVKGDRKREPDETFSVRLSNATGAIFADAAGTVTILNDD